MGGKYHTHNLKVVGLNPTPATNSISIKSMTSLLINLINYLHFKKIANTF